MATISSTSVGNSVAYINGNVFTVNDQNPWVEAFIVGPDGTFTHIGTTKEVQALAKQQNLIIYDLRNQFVMPGIHDAHVHMLWSSVARTSQILLPDQGLNFDNVAEELKKGSCVCKYANANEDWLVGWTYAIENFDREALDKDFADVPVVIHGGAGHSVYLNSEAMKRTGYSIDTEPDGQGTRYIRNEKGQLTGEMAEMSMSKVLTQLPQPNLAHTKRALRDAQHLLHRAGVTSCQEASANTLLLHALRELEAENDLKLEMFTHIVYAPDWIGSETSESLHELLEQAATYKSKHVDTRFVKIILDGVPLPPYFTHAGLTEDGKVDESKLLTLNLFEAVRKYDEKGMTMKVHCTGHGSTRLTLDAFEAARKANPNGPRHEVAHCSGVHDDDLARYKTLNVTAEMSPAFFFVHPVTSMSKGLMDWNFPKMIAADAHLTIGSDWGASTLPDILPFMGGIAEGVGNGDKALGGAKICRMLTLAGAEAVGREKELGSIEVGKKANFIAVSKNLGVGDFEGATVMATWFEGEIVYEATTN